MKRNVQNTKFQTPNTNKGITLVALVITIIVLLILAGVAINMAINSDGLFGKANEASKKWNESVENETDTIEDLLKEIGVINWEKAKAEAVAPASQATVPKTTIGIDAKGEVVNMDLWKFNIDEITGGYGLQDTIAFTTEASADIKALEEAAGYRGDFTNVSIPQYISTDNGETWTPVTNLDWTFYGCTELTQIDKIPDTVISMRYTFRECSNLSEVGELSNSLQNMMHAFYGTGIINMPVIPDSVNNMYGTFSRCKKLSHVTSIPDGIENLIFTFMGCELLAKAPNIPNSVKDLSSAFSNCISLKEAPTIPEGVKNLSSTFEGCKLLERVPNIPEGVENLKSTFMGCELLEKVPNIPRGVYTLNSTFYNCTSLKVAPTIPNTVENMNFTFYGCTSLETASTIPSSVNTMIQVFQGCSKLRGNIEINASVTGKEITESDGEVKKDYHRVLYNCTEEGLTLTVSGTCEFIDEIIAQAANPRITKATNETT